MMNDKIKGFAWGAALCALISLMGGHKCTGPRSTGDTIRIVTDTAVIVRTDTIRHALSERCWWRFISLWPT